MLVCDCLGITHSFSITLANIAINNITLKTRFFGLYFRCRKCRCILNHFYVMRLQATEFSEITHGKLAITSLLHYYADQGHSRSRILVPIESSYTPSY